jgi:hypothetical protein
MAANYINSPSGIYGYKHNDDEASPLKKITVRAIGPKPDIGLKKYGTNYGLDLFPGEGVYSKIENNSPLPGGSGTNIKYAGLQKSGSGSVSPNGPYNNGVLLTYNVNTERIIDYISYAETGDPEQGYVTGADGDTWPGSGGARRADDFPYPLKIDARDLPRQDYLKSLKDGIKVFNEGK